MPLIDDILGGVPQRTPEKKSLADNIISESGLKQVDVTSAILSAPIYSLRSTDTNIGNYIGDSDFDYFGYDPGRDNETLYDANQTAGEWWSNVGNRLWDRSSAVFKDSFNYADDFKDIKKVLNGIETGDRANLSKLEEEFQKNYPLYSSPFESKGPLGYFSKGAHGKWGTVLDQLGFTVGTIGNFVVTEAAFALMTEGVGLLGTAIKAPLLLGKVFKGARALKIAQQATKARSYKSVHKLLEYSNKAQKTLSAKIIRYGKGKSSNLMTPMTTKGIKTFARGLEEGNIAKIAGGAGKFVMGVYSQFHMASNEAIIESADNARVYRETLIADFIRKNGREPLEGEELEKIDNMTVGAARFTYWGNVSVLMVSNAIQLDNIFGSFKSGRKLLDFTDTGLGKVYKSGLKNTLKEGGADIFVGYNKLATWKKLAIGAANLGKKTLITPLSEGFEESFQRTVGTAARDYVSSKYNTGAYSLKDSLTIGLKDGFSEEGMEEFWAGVMTGAIMGSAGSAISGTMFATNKASREASEKKAVELNNLHFDIMNNATQNASEQVVQSEDMFSALNNNDQDAYKNARAKSRFFSAAAMHQMGKYEAWKSTIANHRNLSEPELLVIYKSLGLSTKEEIVKKLDDTLKETDRAVELYKNAEEDISNPYEYWYLEDTDAKKYEARINYLAINTMRGMRAQAEFLYGDKLDRLSSLEREAFSTIPRETLNEFLTFDGRKFRQLHLADELISLNEMLTEDASAETKKKTKQRIKEVEEEISLLGSYDEETKITRGNKIANAKNKKNADTDGFKEDIFQTQSEVDLYETKERLKKYIKLRTGKELMDKDLDSLIEKLADIYSLENDSEGLRDFRNSFNYLSQFEGGSYILESIKDVITKREQEIIDYANKRRTARDANKNTQPLEERSGDLSKTEVETTLENIEERKKEKEVITNENTNIKEETKKRIAKLEKEITDLEDSTLDDLIEEEELRKERTKLRIQGKNSDKRTKKRDTFEEQEDITTTKQKKKGVEPISGQDIIDSHNNLSARINLLSRSVKEKTEQIASLKEEIGILRKEVLSDTRTIETLNDLDNRLTYLERIIKTISSVLTKLKRILNKAIKISAKARGVDTLKQQTFSENEDLKSDPNLKFVYELPRDNFNGAVEIAEDAQTELDSLVTDFEVLQRLRDDIGTERVIIKPVVLTESEIEILQSEAEELTKIIDYIKERVSEEPTLADALKAAKQEFQARRRKLGIKDKKLTIQEKAELKSINLIIHKIFNIQNKQKNAGNTDINEVNKQAEEILTQIKHTLAVANIPLKKVEEKVEEKDKPTGNVKNRTTILDKLNSMEAINEEDTGHTGEVTLITGKNKTVKIKIVQAEVDGVISFYTESKNSTIVIWDEKTQTLSLGGYNASIEEIKSVKLFDNSGKEIGIKEETETEEKGSRGNIKGAFNLQFGKSPKQQDDDEDIESQENNILKTDKQVQLIVDMIQQLERDGENWPKRLSDIYIKNKAVIDDALANAKDTSHKEVITEVENDKHVYNPTGTVKKRNLKRAIRFNRTMSNTEKSQLEIFDEVDKSNLTDKEKVELKKEIRLTRERYDNVLSNLNPQGQYLAADGTYKDLYLVFTIDDPKLYPQESAHTSKVDKKYRPIIALLSDANGNILTFNQEGLISSDTSIRQGAIRTEIITTKKLEKYIKDSNTPKDFEIEADGTVDARNSVTNGVATGKEKMSKPIKVRSVSPGWIDNFEDFFNNEIGKTSIEKWEETTGRKIEGFTFIEDEGIVYFTTEDNQDKLLVIAESLNKHMKESSVLPNLKETIIKILSKNEEYAGVSSTLMYDFIKSILYIPKGYNYRMMYNHKDSTFGLVDTETGEEITDENTISELLDSLPDTHRLNIDLDAIKNPAGFNVLSFIDGKIIKIDEHGEHLRGFNSTYETFLEFVKKISNVTDLNNPETLGEKANNRFFIYETEVKPVVPKAAAKKNTNKTPKTPEEVITAFVQPDPPTQETSEVEVVEYKGNKYSVDFSKGEIINLKTKDVLVGGVTSPVGDAVFNLALELKDAREQRDFSLKEIDNFSSEELSDEDRKKQKDNARKRYVEEVARIKNKSASKAKASDFATAQVPTNTGEELTPEQKEKATMLAGRNNKPTQSAKIDDSLSYTGNETLEERFEKELEQLKKSFGNVPELIERYRLLNNVINSTAWGNWSTSTVNIFKDAPEGTIYHEMWHDFSQLILTKNEKNKLYKEALKLFPEINNNDKLTSLEKVKAVEEKIADDWKAYMLSDGKLILKGKPARNTIFRKLLRFIKSLFNKVSNAITGKDLFKENNVDILRTRLDGLYSRLRLGNINSYSKENALFNGTLNSSKDIRSVLQSNPLTNINVEQSYQQLYDHFNSTILKFIRSKGESVDLRKYITDVALQEEALETVRNSFLTTVKNFENDIDTYSKNITSLYAALSEPSTFEKLKEEFYGNNIEEETRIIKDSDGNDIEIDKLTGDEVNEDSQTKNQLGTKGADQTYSFDLASKVSKALFAGIPIYAKYGDKYITTRTANDAFNAVYNSETLWNIVQEEVSNIQDYDDFLNKLIDITNKVPAVIEILTMIPIYDQAILNKYNAVKDKIQHEMIRYPDKQLSSFSAEPYRKTIFSDLRRTKLQQMITYTSFRDGVPTTIFTPAASIKLQMLEDLMYERLSNLVVNNDPSLSDLYDYTPETGAFTLDINKLKKYIKTKEVDLSRISNLDDYFDIFDKIGLHLSKESILKDPKAKAKFIAAQPNEIIKYILSLPLSKTGDMVALLKSTISSHKGFTGQGSRIKQLLSLQAEFVPQIASNSVYSAKGKTQYEQAEHTYITYMLSIINSEPNLSLLELTNKYPQLSHLNTKKNLFAKGNFLNALFDESGKRKKDTYGKPVEVNVSNMNGVVVSFGENSDKDLSEATSDLSPNEKLIFQEIPTLLKYGVQSNVRASDKSMEYALIFSTFNSKHKEHFVKLKDVLFFMEGKESEFGEILLDEVKNAISVINKHKTIKSNIKDYRTRRNDFVFFDKFFSDELKGKLTTEESVYANEEEILNSIRNYFNTKSDEMMEKLQKDESVLILDKLEIESLPSTTSSQKLKVYYAYSMMHNLEQYKFIYGDLAYYKDPIKRLPAFNSSGRIPIHDRYSIQAAKESGTHRLGQRHYNAKNKITSEVRTNSKVRISTVDDIIAKAQPDFKEIVKILDENIDKIQNDYLDNPSAEKTDAQCLCTLDFYKFIMDSMGEWSPAQEETYKRLFEGKPLTKSMEGMFPPIKLGHTGNAILIKDNPKLNEDTKQYHKYSLMPIIPGAYKNYGMGMIEEELYKQDLDYIVFGSGVKVGAYVDDDNNLPKLYVDGKVNPKFLVTQLDITGFKNQLKIDPKQKAKVIFGTQFRTLLFSDFMEHGKFVNDENGEISKLYDRFVDAIDEVWEDGIKLLESDYGISLNSSGNFEIVDHDKLVAEIKRKQGIKSSSSDYKSALEVENGKFLKILESTSEPQLIQDTVFSLLNNTLIKQKLVGDAMIQASSVGFETKEELEAGGEQEDLKIYSKKFSKIREMEVMVSFNYKAYGPLLHLTHKDGKRIKTVSRLNEMLKDDKFRKKVDNGLILVGYRIPTQGHNSMDVLRIKEFLPESSANTIIVPGGLVTKTGSDFDIDKMQVFRKQFENINTKEYKTTFLNYLKNDKETMDNVTNYIEQVVANGSYASQALNEVLNKYVLTGRASDKAAARARIKKAPMDYLSNLYDIIRERPDVKLTPQEQVFEEILGDYYDKREQNNLQVVDTPTSKIIDITAELLLRNSMMSTLLKPNDVELLKNEKTLVYMKEQGYEDPKSKDTEPVTTKGADPLYIMEKRNAGFDLKKALGIAAVASKMHALFQMIDYTLPANYSSKDIEFNTNIYINHNSRGGKVSMSNIKDANLEIKITHLINQFIDAYVDGGTDDFASYLNAGYDVAGTLMTMVQMGVPIDDALALVSIESIKKFSKIKSNSMINTVVSEIKKLKRPPSKVKRMAAILIDTVNQSEDFLNKNPKLRDIINSQINLSVDPMDPKITAKDIFRFSPVDSVDFNKIVNNITSSEVFAKLAKEHFSNPDNIRKGNDLIGLLQFIDLNQVSSSLLNDVNRIYTHDTNYTTSFGESIHRVDLEEKLKEDNTIMSAEVRKLFENKIPTKKLKNYNKVGDMFAEAYPIYSDERILKVFKQLRTKDNVFVENGDTFAKVFMNDISLYILHNSNIAEAIFEKMDTNKSGNIHSKLLDIKGRLYNHLSDGKENTHPNLEMLRFINSFIEEEGKKENSSLVKFKKFKNIKLSKEDVQQYKNAWKNLINGEFAISDSVLKEDITSMMSELAGIILFYNGWNFYPGAMNTIIPSKVYDHYSAAFRNILNDDDFYSEFEKNFPAMFKANNKRKYYKYDKIENKKEGAFKNYALSGRTFAKVKTRGVKPTKSTKSTKTTKTTTKTTTSTKATGKFVLSKTKQGDANLSKDQGKANLANAYISFPVKGTASYGYFLDAKKAKIPVNKEINVNKNTIAFVSVNGNNKANSGQLNSTYKMINIVLAGGGTIIMDSTNVANSTYNKSGEGAIQSKLGKPDGQTSKGYNYWGNNPERNLPTKGSIKMDFGKGLKNKAGQPVDTTQPAPKDMLVAINLQKAGLGLHFKGDKAKVKEAIDMMIKFNEKIPNFKPHEFSRTIMDIGLENAKKLGDSLCK